MSKKVFLIPTDFSEVCNNAINQAISMAGLMDADIYLLHVVNAETKSWLKENDLDLSAIDIKLQTITDDFKLKYGVSMQYIVREGSIFNEIADAAKEIKANLIFLGTHGKTGIQHLTGSFAMKVITSSEAPVLVVQRRKIERLPKLIVLPLTSEAGPMEKTIIAANLAQSLDATIHILQCDDNEKVAEAAQNMMEYFNKNDVKSQLVISASGSHYTNRVLEYSVENNADMILIMTNPDKNWTSFIFGSYDEELVFNAAQIPVLCVNPRKKEVDKIFKD